MENTKVPMAPCACGCGELVKQVMHNGRVTMMRPGHHRKVVVCECGCGQQISRIFRDGKLRRFKPGHHQVKDGIVRRTQVRTCLQCSKEFSLTKNTRFCSKDCYWKYRGYHDGAPDAPDRRAFSSKREVFRECRSPRIQRLYMLATAASCMRCQWEEITEILELHHVDGNKRNGKRENLMLLCPNCHNTIHFLSKTGSYDPHNRKRAQEIRQKQLA